MVTISKSFACAFFPLILLLLPARTLSNKCLPNINIGDTIPAHKIAEIQRSMDTLSPHLDSLKEVTNDMKRFECVNNIMQCALFDSYLEQVTEIHSLTKKTYDILRYAPASSSQDKTYTNKLYDATETFLQFASSLNKKTDSIFIYLDPTDSSARTQHWSDPLRSIGKENTKISNLTTFLQQLTIPEVEVEVKVIDSLTNKEVADFSVTSKSKYYDSQDIFGLTVHAKRRIRPGEKIFTITKGAFVREKTWPVDGNDPNTWTVRFIVNNYQ